MKVTFEVKKLSDAHDMAVVNAITGVMYMGYEAANGSPKQSALVNEKTLLPNSEESLKSFFKTNPYTQFIISVADNNMEIVKDKKKYRVGVTVAVDKKRLRQALEKEKIIRKLGDGLW